MSDMKLSHKQIFAFLLLFGSIVASAQKPQVQTSAPAEKTTVPTSATPAAPKPAPAKKTVKKETPKAVPSNRYMAIKTNVAYDAFAVLNLAWEMQVASKWTVEVPVIWSFWDWNTEKGLRTATLQPAVKYYFGTPGRGSALGAGVTASWFNMRYNEKRYQDSGRPALGASVNYSYTLPLGRDWALEFAIGIGYVNMCYNTYYNIDNGAWISKRQRDYFGPTSLGISLSYKI